MRRNLSLVLFVLLAVLLVSTTVLKLVRAHDADEIVNTAGVQVQADDDDDDMDEGTHVHQTQSQPTLSEPILDYLAPKPNGSVAFFESFNEDFADRWIVTKDDKYTGEWKWTTARTVVGIEGDKGLLVPLPARHYGIKARISPAIDNTDKEEFVVQYEVKLQDKLECGGAYVKLLMADEETLNAPVRDNSPYVIMFGPDKCGSNNKVHFIFRHQNPKSGEWQEKHMTGAPTIKNDQKTHLYTLVVRKDNSFEVFIDGKSARKGSLLADFTPAVNPPKEIDDPTDSKPEDWIDEAKIPDPTATKPDDWDEDEPFEIDDPNDVKPNTWLDDEPELIPDPDAQKPETWDDDEDGEWQAALVPNPKCEEGGCGAWKPRKIRNPLYRGKWSAPLIDNPAYKGPWKARQIPNPDYFEDLNPHNFPKIGALAIEIWTMQGNIMFDNFIITHDYNVAKQYADATWAFKFAREMEKEPQAAADTKDAASTDWLSRYIAMLTPYMLQLQDFLQHSSTATIATIASVMVGLPLVFASFCWCCLRSSPAVKPVATRKPAKNTKKPAEKTNEEEEEEEVEKEEEEKEEKEEESTEKELKSKGATASGTETPSTGAKKRGKKATN